MTDLICLLDHCPLTCFSKGTEDSIKMIVNEKVVVKRIEGGEVWKAQEKAQVN